jgi:hypothetical protein
MPGSMITGLDDRKHQHFGGELMFGALAPTGTCQSCLASLTLEATSAWQLPFNRVQTRALQHPT